MWFKDAGAIIGRGGANIKQLRLDVSIIFILNDFSCDEWTLSDLYIETKVVRLC